LFGEFNNFDSNAELSVDELSNHGLGEQCGLAPELSCEDQAAAHFDTYCFGYESDQMLMNDIEFAAYYHLEYQGEIDADNLFRWCDEDRDGYLTLYEFEHCYCNEGEYVYVQPQHTIQRCSSTAASLYGEFNNFDSNAELSVDEL
jgi:hypothetical protein